MKEVTASLLIEGGLQQLRNRKGAKNSEVKSNECLFLNFRCILMQDEFCHI